MRMRANLPRGPRSRTAVLALFLSVVAPSVFAQSSSDAADTLHGTVVNSVTHEAIPRALVASPDERFATLTDSQGRFEFTFPKVEPPKSGDTSSAATSPAEALAAAAKIRPFVLFARKPGFLQDNRPGTDLALAPNAKELTLSLVPEAIITGQVELPTSEAPDSIQLQLYRRQVQDGRAHWVPAAVAVSRSTGEFRFADLPAGTYKLLTRELLDRDPLTFDPKGQLYGYPPVYYEDAPDFLSATTIAVSAGETAQAHISLVKQPYYKVKIAVENVPQGAGLNVNVHSQGRNGPGYSLGYNPSTQTIEGTLPNGTYSVEASGFGPADNSAGQSAFSGLLTLTIKGAAAEGAHLTLVPGSSIPIDVKEGFANKGDEGPVTFNNGKRSFTLNGPRRYLNVTLEPADEFGGAQDALLRPPQGPGDEALVIDNVLPGRYWVRVQTARGYVASVRSGMADLQHEPFVVGAGGEVSPIEIVLLDDTATIDGTVEGIVPPPNPSPEPQPGLETAAPVIAPPGPPPAHIYCIPLPDSGGEATQISAAPDGSFTSQPLAPGTYRLLAFEHEQIQLEYRNPELMKTYADMGPTVRVTGGQKEHVTLHLIMTNEQ